MATATIKLFDVASDIAAGTFQMDVDYKSTDADGNEIGFDANSHAHMFATILLRAADQLAANLGMPEDAATITEMATASPE